MLRGFYAAVALAAVAICTLSLLAMSGQVNAAWDSISSPSSFSTAELDALSSSPLSVAEKQLSQVRKTMHKIQKEAITEHKEAAAEAMAAAKDRHLQKALNRFAKQRQLAKGRLATQADITRREVADINSNVISLEKSIHAATQKINSLAQKSQATLHSAPLLRKEIADTTDRLLQLTSEHEFLKEKLRVLSAAAAPHDSAYQRDEQDLKTMELQVQQLKAQAKLASAQASVIADNLRRRLQALARDATETSKLKKETASLPPRSSVKFATPRFVSLAAKAKTIYSKAGTMLQKVQADNAKALAEKQQLMKLEGEMAADDKKAASIDLSAAKLSDAAATQKYMRNHFQKDITAARRKLAQTKDAEKRMKLRLAKAKTALKNVTPTVHKDKLELKEEEKMLLADQTSIDTDKARAKNAEIDLTQEQASIRADLAETKKDLKLAVGAGMAARVHEKKSQRLAKEAAHKDQRVEKLLSELKKSDKKVAEARKLEQEADKASEQLAEIDSTDN